MMQIIVTDGVDFIRFSIVCHIIHDTTNRVVSVDKLIYAGNLKPLSQVEKVYAY